MSKQNTVELPKMVTAQILMEYGVPMESSVLKMLVEERMKYEIPMERWNKVVSEISLVSGMILSE